MRNVIEVKNVVKKYKNLTALDHFSLDVKEGEILGLLGPNGSGKSTAMNCMLSLLEYNEGSIKIFGQEMRPDCYDIKSKIGVVMQNVAVFEELTVYENIDYFCGLYIKEKAKRKQYVEEAIQLVGLNDFRKFVPKKLSGGLLRRLNIACGIAHKPQLIFLDEPTVAVDPQSRNNILEGIETLNKQGATIVYTTHYMEEVEQICNRIVIIDKGKTLATGSKEELKAMIKMGEKITITVNDIKEEQLDNIRNMKDVTSLTVNENNIHIIFDNSVSHLVPLLDYLKAEHIICDRIYSELPTLNDVFLSITGKELRD